MHLHACLQKASHALGCNIAIAVMHHPCLHKGLSWNWCCARLKQLVWVATGHAYALRLLHKHRRAQVFDVVDIDPYGSPTELLDMAVQSVAHGGLMAVTATDMAVLCGNNAEACFTKYGSYSLHRDYNHEQALRILLACIAMHAARHKRVIEPVLSLSIDFYIRVFLRVRISPAESKLTASKLSYLWQSSGCDSWWLQPAGVCANRDSGKGEACKFSVGKGPPMPQVCPISGGKFHMGGPIWSEPLYQADVVRQISEDINVRSSTMLHRMTARKL